MEAIGDHDFHAMRAQHELDMAALATDPVVKVLHLNMAARYATLQERADAKTSAAKMAPVIDLAALARTLDALIAFADQKKNSVLLATLDAARVQLFGVLQSAQRLTSLLNHYSAKP